MWQCKLRLCHPHLRSWRICQFSPKVMASLLGRSTTSRNDRLSICKHVLKGQLCGREGEGQSSAVPIVHHD